MRRDILDDPYIPPHNERHLPTVPGMLLTILVVGMAFFVFVVALGSLGINWAALD